MIAVLSHRIDLLGDVSSKNRLRCGTGERRTPGQQLIGKRSHSIYVGSMIYVRIGSGLLGRHIGRCAERYASGSELIAARGFTHCLSYTEIHYQRVAAREHHVVGLDVAVHNTLLMRVSQRIHHFANDLYCFVYRQLTVFCDAMPQGLAFDVGHHVVEETVRFTGVVQRQDVRVCEIGGYLNLSEESLGTQCGGELGAQYLQRNLAVVLEILREIHGSHPTLADFPFNFVTVG